MEEQARTLVLVIGSFAVGGFSVLALAVLLVRAVLQSPVLITGLENLAKSYPADVREILVLIGQLLVAMNNDVPEFPAGSRASEAQHFGQVPAEARFPRPVDR